MGPRQMLWVSATPHHAVSGARGALRPALRSLRAKTKAGITLGPYAVRLGTKATAIYRRNALLHLGVKDPETLSSPDRRNGGPVERIVWT
jgi:hypothetical protein